MESLPIELFDDIAQHLFLEDLNNLSLVSKEINYKASGVKKIAIDGSIFVNALRVHYGEHFEAFNRALVDSGALIAGGSVCGAYHGFKSDDFDVYVPIDGVETMTDMLFDIGYEGDSFRVTSEYDSSFMKKNGIMSRIEFRTAKSFKSVDLMVMRNGISPLKVVTNFDLTFCEAFYNGFHVEASEPVEFMNKKGRLRKDYLESFIGGNRFILGRIRKYKMRGFSIDIDLSEIKNFTLSVHANPNNLNYLVRLLNESLSYFSGYKLTQKRVIKTLVDYFEFKNDLLDKDFIIKKIIDLYSYFHDNGDYHNILNEYDNLFYYYDHMPGYFQVKEKNRLELAALIDRYDSLKQAQ
jgi:hypothetical protein